MRDDLELSLLTEFGLEVAAVIGEAWNLTYEAICYAVGLDPRLFDEFEDTLEQAKDDQ